MFWSGNYTAVRELNFLLKEENLTLSQVLEADDILPECKADNKELIQFLTRPDVLAELITLITEEPPKDVELTAQYRHASVASEVLTSQLSLLSDRLSSDTEQMHRLCDFLHKPPPLNPLLASYFSKTVEMLLERNPKQDWYLYHIVGLRVMDFFKSRPDFLPGLLRHMSTSSIVDVFKCFIRLDDLFSKNVIEWIDQYQVVDCLIEIVCCTYNPEEPPPVIKFKSTTEKPPEHVDKAEQETSEKSIIVNTREDVKKVDGEIYVNNNSSDSSSELNITPPSEAAGETDNLNIKTNNMNNEVDLKENPLQELTESGDTKKDDLEQISRIKKERMQAVASANAAALLVDLINNGCSGEFDNTRSQTSTWLMDALLSRVPALLQGMSSNKRAAIVSGAKILCAIQQHTYTPNPPPSGSVNAELEKRVESAVAPHLPLLHQVLLKPPEQSVPFGAVSVGQARIAVVSLLALLARCQHPDIPAAMLALGTPGACFELLLAQPQCTLLHAAVCELLRHALDNRAYSLQYATHLFVECDVLSRLMDIFDDTEANRSKSPSAQAVRGHAFLCLRLVLSALGSAGWLHGRLVLPAALLERWETFVKDVLKPRAYQQDTPLGGLSPSDISVYDYMKRSQQEAYAEPEDAAAAPVGTVTEIVSIEQQLEGLSEEEREEYCADWARRCESVKKVLEIGVGGEEGGGGRGWVRELLGEASPWESAPAADSSNEGWAQFEDFGDDSAAPADAPDAFADRASADFWNARDAASVSDDFSALRVDAAGSAQLTSHVLTAMSSLSAATLATLGSDDIRILPAEPQLSAANCQTEPAVETAVGCRATEAGNQTGAEPEDR